MKTAAYIKLDIDVKKQAQRLAEDLGFSLSTLINAQLKQLVRKQEITFQVFPDEQMSPALEKKLAKIHKDIKQGKNLSRPLSSHEEVEEYFRTL